MKNYRVVLHRPAKEFYRSDLYGYFCQALKSTIMKILFAPVIALLLAWTLHSCQSSSAPASFCDTACLKDSLKFEKAGHPLHPSVYISVKNCMGDTLVWNHDALGVNRKLGFTDLFGTPIRLNKDHVSCYIKDTSYAWLAFNNCDNGRGYLLKIPFSKTESISRKSSAINPFDPKFSIAEGLVVYSDRGNLFAEEMATGKTAMMTFGAKADIDYDAIHETVDSVNVTPTRMWARVKLGDEWKVVEKDITLK